MGSILPCSAQRVSDFLAVKSWQGSLKLKADHSGNSTGLGGVEAYNFSWSADLQFRLEEFSPGGQFWRGKFTGGSAAIRHKVNSSGSSGGCTLTSTVEGQGLPTNPEFFLFVGPGENYSLAITGYSIPSRVTVVSVCGGKTSVITNDTVGNWFSNELNRNVVFALPAAGLELIGGGKYEMGLPIPLFTALLSGSVPKLPADVKWEFRPLEVDPLELVVDPAGYDTFRPTANLNGNPGNSISVTATLQTKSGKPAQQGASKFIFELLETSQEPGIAMNWPRDATDQDYDLRIAAAAGLLLADPVKRQRAESLPTIPLATSASVKIDSFDWGGWSRLKVTALLADGKTLQGYLKGKPDQTEIRLPQRAANSFIADSWKKDNAISGSDSADDETAPMGDGNPGDGLTVYEEYRGFYVSQEHIEGNLKKKDYFAVNLAGSAAEGGIALFQRLSGLAVHKKLLQTELSFDRVINKNVSAGPHRVNQHGVILKVQAFEGYAEAVSTGKHPSTPKDFEFVGLPVSIAPRPTFSQAVSYASSTVAHEMFHTVNVYHHGEGDVETVWRLGPNDTVFEGEQPIEVYREPALNVTLNVVARLKTKNVTQQGIWLGKPQGQHSGVENCIMRYDSAQAYERDGEVGGRYSVSETPGALLCDSRQGTGVNASRTPQIRYGDAAQGRGTCNEQILVNDAISATVR
jgi:hypothetical protein